MRPHPDHRFHDERYDDKMLAVICANREGKWSAEDSLIADEILTYRLDYPKR